MGHPLVWGTRPKPRPPASQATSCGRHSNFSLRPTLSGSRACGVPLLFLYVRRVASTTATQTPLYRPCKKQHLCSPSSVRTLQSEKAAATAIHNEAHELTELAVRSPPRTCDQRSEWKQSLVMNLTTATHRMQFYEGGVCVARQERAGHAGYLGKVNASLATPCPQCGQRTHRRKCFASHVGTIATQSSPVAGFD